MIRLSVAIFIFISNLSFAIYAQERVVIGTQRLSENGALFLAAAQGCFKAEGIDLAMTATDFGLARFTPAAFDAGEPGEVSRLVLRAG
jgi:hypothetical protein